MKKISDILFEDYFINEEFSSQTSSFWKEWGKYQNIIQTDKGYKISSRLIADFRENSLFNSIKQIPTRIYLSKLLKKCDKKIVKAINFIAKKSSRVFSYDLSRQALTLNILKKELSDLDNKSFCIIGDGYGTLGTLIKKIFPKSKIIFINIGRTLFFDFFYTEKVCPFNEHKLIRDIKDCFSNDFNYIEAEKVKNIKVEADIFVNISSMQEMNIEDINLYFNIMRNQNSDTWFYCCNRISKELPDGKLINFDEYPWQSSDKIIFEELCPWHQKYPINKPPFLKEFKGKHKHKLVKINLIKKSS